MIQLWHIKSAEYAGPNKDVRAIAEMQVAVGSYAVTITDYSTLNGPSKEPIYWVLETLDAETWEISSDYVVTPDHPMVNLSDDATFGDIHNNLVDAQSLGEEYWWENEELDSDITLLMGEKVKDVLFSQAVHDLPDQRLLDEKVSTPPIFEGAQYQFYPDDIQAAVDKATAFSSIHLAEEPDFTKIEEPDFTVSKKLVALAAAEITLYMLLCAGMAWLVRKWFTKKFFKEEK